MHLVILLCLLLLAPLQSLAVPINYQFDGLLASGTGTVTGSWTLDAGQITTSSFTAIPQGLFVLRDAYKDNTWYSACIERNETQFVLSVAGDFKWGGLRAYVGLDW